MLFKDNSRQLYQQFKSIQKHHHTIHLISTTNTVLSFADSTVKHESIEQEDYWEKEGELEGVEEHRIYLLRFNRFRNHENGLRRNFPRRYAWEEQI